MTTDSTAKPPRSKKGRILPVVAVLVAAGGGYVGWHYWTDGRFKVSTDNAYVQADLVTVAPKVPGYVSEVLVRDNQHVSEGQLLARIDDRDYSARAQQARALLSAREAKVGTLDAQAAWQETQIERARAGLESAKAELDRAGLELDRARSLAVDKWTTKQRLDTSTSDELKARSALASAKAQLAAEQGMLSVLKAQRVEAEGDIAQARAALALAETDLDATVIKASHDGVVGNRSVEPGQYAKAGSQLMVLVPLPEVHIVANFKETQLKGMRPGQRVEVTVDAWPDQPVEGWVESMAPASGSQFSLLPPDNATGNFTKVVQRVPVRIAVPPTSPLAGRLRPGLSVEVTFDLRDPGHGSSDVAGVLGAVDATLTVPGPGVTASGSAVAGELPR